MLATSPTHPHHHPHPIHQPPRDPLLQAFFANPQAPAVTSDPVRLQDMPPQAQRAISAYLDDPGDADAAPEWTEEDVVHLHWRLLLELRRLPDPETPLEEKLDTLAWALTDPSFDGRPFSFANCLRVVGTSPMSPTPYFGLIQVDEIRAWLRTNSRKWIDATIARYPDWVQALIKAQPDWVARQLARNPQWVNEQIKARRATQQDDLFAAVMPACRARFRHEPGPHQSGLGACRHLRSVGAGRRAGSAAGRRCALRGPSHRPAGTH